MCTDCEADDMLANIVNCVADVVFLSVGGCMTAQVHREMKIRNLSSPSRELMNR